MLPETDAAATGGSGPTTDPSVAPRSSPTPARPTGWLRRLRKSALTPSDPDQLIAVEPSDPSKISLLQRGPFQIGFFLTIGALAALGLGFTTLRLAPVLVMVMLSLFLALGLNPSVEWLHKRGIARGIAVALVALVVIGVIALGIWALLPVVTVQVNNLFRDAPGYLADLRRNPQIAELDAQFDLIARVTEFLTSGDLVSALFGGILGAGQIVANLVFSTIITVVLTLYFLGSLQAIKDVIYELAPASRRPRVRYLSNEMFRRVGGYVTGLFLVVSTAATTSFVFMNFVGLGQYSLALSVVVASCAFIPLIGSTLSMVIISIVAFSISPVTGLITLIYFLIYQQIDTYFIQPRIFERSVHVPGVIVILAAVSGGTIYGMMGALLAIPTVAALLLLYREVLIPALDRQ
ncbi:MAG: AI-2E family transporter [Micropruina sp.]|nr:AI-2E family transporter [Micropruina sp.]